MEKEKKECVKPIFNMEEEKMKKIFRRGIPTIILIICLLTGKADSIKDALIIWIVMYALVRGVEVFLEWKFGICLDDRTHGNRSATGKETNMHTKDYYKEVYRSSLAERVDRAEAYRKQHRVNEESNKANE